MPRIKPLMLCVTGGVLVPLVIAAGLLLLYLR
jgi:hypothetical protein